MSKEIEEMLDSVRYPVDKRPNNQGVSLSNRNCPRCDSPWVRLPYFKGQRFCDSCTGRVLITALLEKKVLTP